MTIVQTGLTRAGLLRRGAVGGGALLVTASGLGVLPGIASADTLPDGDLAYLRLLIAAELLAVDFQTQALKSRKLRRSAGSVIRAVRADEQQHYLQLAQQMVDAGQTPATSADIDFSYPKGSFRSQSSILKLAGTIEHLLLGAYLDAVENVQTPTLRLPIGQIAASEAQHTSALAALRGGSIIGDPFPQPVPMAAASNALDRFES